MHFRARDRRAEVEFALDHDAGMFAPRIKLFVGRDRDGVFGLFVGSDINVGGMLLFADARDKGVHARCRLAQQIHLPAERTPFGS